MIREKIVLDSVLEALSTLEEEGKTVMIMAVNRK